MVKLTLVYRLYDSLPLAESLDNDGDPDIDKMKRYAKELITSLRAWRSGQPTKASLESAPFMFHYVITDGSQASGVCFLTLTDKAYPKKLAHQYLDELATEFNRTYLGQIESAQKPYQFIKFDTFIQRTRKLYLDTRTQRNLQLLTDDLKEVHQVMTKNLQEVLGHGERLEKMSLMSSQLSMESKKYATKSRELYLQALIQKYLPWAVLAIVGLLVFFVRRWFKH